MNCTNLQIFSVHVLRDFFPGKQLKGEIFVGARLRIGPVSQPSFVNNSVGR